MGKKGRSPHGERGLKLNALVNRIGRVMSLSSRRAWIEMFCKFGLSIIIVRRSPHGERGLKSVSDKNINRKRRGRSPHGERGLKCQIKCTQLGKKSGRSPHGERGLKSSLDEISIDTVLRRSPHGERGLKWTKMVLRFYKQSVALLTESVD